MRLELDGRINSLYVQSLCMIFFRGEKFPLNEENPRGILSVKAIDIDGGIECHVTLTYDGKATSAMATSALEDNKTYERASKTAVGKAVLTACNKLTGYMPPWGLLTGIRPSVVAQEMIEQYGEEKAIQKLQDTYLLSKEKALLSVSVAKNEHAILDRYDENTCSLYVSIPFCPTRCSYCSFISYATDKLFKLMPDYVNRVTQEIKNTFNLIEELGLKLITVYVGGGTPTCLSCAQLEQIISTISACFKDKPLEFTVECGRPDTITTEKLNLLKKYGVDRVSVNPQSLNDEVLNSIGRHHTVQDFFNAYEIVKKSEIGVINTDLIAGLSGDSFESFKNTVDRIIELEPQNVTVHSFSVKKSAQVTRENQDIYNIDGDFAVKSVDYARQVLTDNGYLPYYMYRQKNTISDLENVGYARQGTEGIYNVLMMADGHTVFGVGAGATTKLVKKVNGKREILRIFSPKYPYEYLQSDQSIELKAIDFLKGGQVMKKIDITFSCERDKIDFVNECEADFEKRLDEASKLIVKSGVSNILLSGPTCSGKTTTANKIIDEFHEAGKGVTVISIDDFFHERDDARTVKENEKIDYDSVDVLDLELLSQCVKNAKTGNNIKVPIFDFVTQSRVGYNAHYITEDEVVLFEGIQAVYPEVTSLFEEKFIGVFININEDVCLNGIEFSRDEIRLIRRLVRDRKFRGASADFTFYLWETVRENEDKNIYPNKNICTVQLDSFMGYELFLIKPYIIEVLNEVLESSKYFQRAKEIKEKFLRLDEIKYDYIPKNSLYTEFLGKK